MAKTAVRMVLREKDMADFLVWKVLCFEYTYQSGKPPIVLQYFGKEILDARFVSVFAAQTPTSGQFRVPCSSRSEGMLRSDSTREVPPRSLKDSAEHSQSKPRRFSTSRSWHAHAARGA